MVAPLHFYTIKLRPMWRANFSFEYLRITHEFDFYFDFLSRFYSFTKNEVDTKLGDKTLRTYL